MTNRFNRFKGILQTKLRRFYYAMLRFLASYTSDRHRMSGYDIARLQRERQINDDLEGEYNGE